MKTSVVLRRKKGLINNPEGFPVYLVINYKINNSYKRKEKVLGYSLPEFWNVQKSLPFEQHPDFENLYPRLLEIRDRIASLDPNETDPDAAIDYILKIPKKKTEAPEFIAWALTYCEDLEDEAFEIGKAGNILERNRKLGNIKVYRTALKQFSVFSGNVKIDEINFALLMGFRRYKLASGVSKTSVFNYLRTLRALFNTCQDYFELPERFPFRKVMNGLKVASYASTKKYLERDSVCQLEAVIYEGAKKRYLDLFLLQFYLGGADLIDVYYLKKNQVKKGRVFFERGKSGTFVLDLALNSKAKKIIKELKDPEGTEYVFPWRKDKLGYENFRRRYQRFLVEIQKDLDIQVKPTGGNIGVKVARHTFATLAVFAGVESDLIREFMGHQRDDVDNYYKARFPQKFRDEKLFSVIGS